MWKFVTKKNNNNKNKSLFKNEIMRAFALFRHDASAFVCNANSISSEIAAVVSGTWLSWLEQRGYRCSSYFPPKYTDFVFKKKKKIHRNFDYYSIGITIILDKYLNFTEILFIKRWVLDMFLLKEYNFKNFPKNFWKLIWFLKN